MDSFILSTDSTCDWTISELDKHDVRYKQSAYYQNGIEHPDMCNSDAEFRAFYDYLRSGNLPTTSQLNEMVMEEYFTRLIEAASGDVVHISISSGIGGGTYPNSVAAAKTVMSKFPGRKIYIVDSLAATQVQGSLVRQGVSARLKGLTALETYESLRKLAPLINVMIMPRDLFHLHRGGRVSKASAVVGSILQIKPLITFTADGNLEVSDKVSGWTKGMRTMVKFAQRQATNLKTDGVFIAHADAYEDALELKNMIQQEIDCPVDIGWIGPVIGTHTGPGTLGLGVIGKERQ